MSTDQIFLIPGYAMAPSSPVSQMAAFIKSIRQAQMIGFWLLNETVGTVAVSQVNSPDIDGEYGSGVVLADQIGPDGALMTPTFSNTNLSRVALGSAFFDSQHDFGNHSVLVWFKADDADFWTRPPLNYERVIGSRTNPGAGEIRLRINNTSGQMTWEINVGSGSEHITLTPTLDTEWKFSAYTRDEVNDRMYYYLNDTRIGSDSGLVAATDNTFENDAPYIGANFGGNDDRWEGSIGPVVWYQTPLLIPEVYEIQSLAYRSYIQRGIDLEPILYMPLIETPSTKTPDEVTGLQLWLDADDISTLYQDSGKTTAVTSDDDPVGAWADKSGNGYDLLQTANDERPLYKTSIQNSLPVLRFDGTDDNLENSTASRTEKKTASSGENPGVTALP